MSMSWDHVCRKCQKEFSSWDGIPLCSDCYTEEDTLKVLKELRKENEEFRKSSPYYKEVKEYEPYKNEPRLNRRESIWSIILDYICG